MQQSAPGGVGRAAERPVAGKAAPTRPRRRGEAALVSERPPPSDADQPATNGEVPTRPRRRGEAVLGSERPPPPDEAAVSYHPKLLLRAEALPAVRTQCEVTRATCMLTAACM